MKKGIVALLTGTMLMMATSAMALTINGSLWENINFSSAINGVDWLANNKPAGTADATFTVSNINFSSNSQESYDNWLNTPNWITGASKKNDYVSAPGYIGTFFEFTGTAYFNANITAQHDDGLWMHLQNSSNSYIFDKSANVGPTPESFNIVAGTYNFDILYSADNGFPEVLQIGGMSTPVPEPATMMLLGLGMACLAVYGKRRQNKA